MYYLTDKYEHMDPRCFGDLTLLVKSILIDNPNLVARYINENTLSDILPLPYDMGDYSIGDITVEIAKSRGQWEDLVWRLSDEIADWIVETFENFQPGDTEIVYLAGTYAITKD